MIVYSKFQAVMAINTFRDTLNNLSFLHSLLYKYDTMNLLNPVWHGGGGGGMMFLITVLKRLGGGS